MMRKGKQMIQDIEFKIICGGYGPGEKIPSLRQLMARFGVSMNTARRGIESLTEKGLLTFRHGSGTYVAERRKLPANCRITVLSVPYSPQTSLTSFAGLALNGVQDAAKSSTFRIHHHPCFLHELDDRLLEKLSAECDGLILLGGYDAILKAPKLHTAAVGLAIHNSYGGAFSLIDLDPIRAAELAVDFFLRNRKDHVAIVSRDRANFRFRGDIFRSLFPGRTVVFREHAEQFDTALGYLYLYGADAAGDAQRFQEHYNRRLCDAHTILCIDGSPMFSGHTELGIPSIAINWRDAGVLAAEECLRRITNPGTVSRRIYLSPELYSEQEEMPPISVKHHIF